MQTADALTPVCTAMSDSSTFLPARKSLDGVVIVSYAAPKKTKHSWVTLCRTDLEDDSYSDIKGWLYTCSECSLYSET